MGKSKKSYLETLIEQGPDPYQIGLHGSIIDLHLADSAAKADIEIKEAAHRENARKSSDGMSLFHSFKKYQSLRDAYRAAQQVPYTIHRKLYNGAVQAFLEGRPENLQEIIAHPEAFQREKWGRATIASAGREILLELLDKNPDPDMPARALAKVTEEDKKSILNGSLYELILRRRDIEEPVYILVKAGAELNACLFATAIDQNVSQTVKDIFLKRGITYEDALTVMRDKPENYSRGAADKLELAMAKETITQLRDLAGQPSETTPPQQAPAEKPEPEAYTGRPKEIRTRPIIL